MSAEDAILARLDGLTVRFDRIEARFDRIESNARDDYQRLAAELRSVEAAVATLQVKAGIWGLMGGLIPAILALTALMVRAVLSGQALGLVPG